MQRINIKYKLTALLALLSTAPLIFLVLNRSSAEIELETENRLRSCQQLAISCSMQLRHQDYLAIANLLDQFYERQPGVQLITFKRFDGLLIHEAGIVPSPSAEMQAPEPAAEGEPTPNQVSIPILRGAQEWGSLDVSYENNLATSQLQQIGKAFGFTIMLNLFTFGMLLRRSLSVLDSGNVVPRRVRNTLDTIAGGVVILDANRKIVMANQAFRDSCHRSLEELIGKCLNDIQFRSDDPTMPWDEAIDQRQRQSGATLSLAHRGETRCFVVNATPIFDAQDKLAGTLVSFEDITTLEEQKQTLMHTLSELEASKEKIHQQNVRLQELASKDALTGAFNRRSLFEQLEASWAESLSNGQPLNCIMLDVDHFKKLNDNHGHAAGDQVLRDVSRTIHEAVGDVGVVGRYGGEEFCVILPAIPLDQAEEVGEKIRRAVEVQLADPYAVTASFGVSGNILGAADYQAMLEQADQALYAAKHGGRNAVCCWSPTLAEEDVVEEPVESEAVELLGPVADRHVSGAARGDHPIAYHAVASLHAALAYKDADTAVHSQRVAEMAVALGRGLMPIADLYLLEIAATLHDIGKVGVPDSILLKPSKLSDEEWKVMQAHAQMGSEIVAASFQSPALAEIIRYHHHRFAGPNPDGEPSGKDIPLGARIISIVDAFDAMVSDRVYRKGRSVDEAFAELRRCAGTQFDPDLVERFIQAGVGWRPDSRFLAPEMGDQLALSIGHWTERAMHAFEKRDRGGLAEALGKLQAAGQQHDLPAIAHLALRLGETLADAAEQDWDVAIPIAQNLLEMCLTVQRMHIRDLAARPQLVPHCPQGEFFRTMRPE